MVSAARVSALVSAQRVSALVSAHRFGVDLGRGKAQQAAQHAVGAGRGGEDGSGGATRARGARRRLLAHLPLVLQLQLARLAQHQVELGQRHVLRLRGAPALLADPLRGTSRRCGARRCGASGSRSATTTGDRGATRNTCATTVSVCPRCAIGWRGRGTGGLVCGYHSSLRSSYLLFVWLRWSSRVLLGRGGRFLLAITMSMFVSMCHRRRHRSRPIPRFSWSFPALLRHGACCGGGGSGSGGGGGGC